eukprot:TRINITY_DN6234_c0_g1_i3.p3 TRINITY_DN6234_c0_g1~~TRINITY_DN6234_c0_g1_i3.p3  ORF type:complete len:277 (-),score=0.82 TRINITY_DN6234_c0_g1_i3:391-1221(-)
MILKAYVINLIGFAFYVALTQSEISIPVFYFESLGPNTVVSPTGQAVPTISGQIASTQITAYQCALICLSYFESCQCCNGFDYNPLQNNGSCYLRQFPSGPDNKPVIQGTKQNQAGWQTYLSWGESTNSTGYTGNQQEYLEIDMTTPRWHIAPISYRIGYSTIGPNIEPLEKGERVRTVGGFLALKNMDLQGCAAECSKLSQIRVCDGFSYNPIQQGTCILKKDLGDPENSIISNEGWQYYWREDNKGINDKCFCPCKKPFQCVLCNETTLDCTLW